MNFLQFARTPKLVRAIAITGAACVAAISPPAAAQDVSENRAWQFETPQEQAARAATLDIMMKRRGGIYAAPIYNTTIARQYNCSVSASAVGNSDSQAANANSPTVTGTSSAATGNIGTTQNGADTGDSTIDVAQRNTAPIGSSAAGSTTTTISGASQQALNSEQENSGDQRASVRDSTACGFGALN